MFGSWYGGSGYDFNFVYIIATPAPRKRFGHRRVGSHGNPPIKIDPQYAAAAAAGQPQSYHMGVSSGLHMSQSHPGEYMSDRVAGDVFTSHQGLIHSRSWTPENNMMAAAYRQQRTSGIDITVLYRVYTVHFYIMLIMA